MRRRRVSGSANTARPYVDNVVAHRPYVHPSCFLTLAILNGPNFRTDSLGEVHFPAVTARARRCTVWGMAAFVVARPSLRLMSFLSCMHCAPMTARKRTSGAYLSLLRILAVRLTHWQVCCVKLREHRHQRSQCPQPTGVRSDYLNRLPTGDKTFWVSSGNSSASTSARINTHGSSTGTSGIATEYNLGRHRPRSRLEAHQAPERHDLRYAPEAARPSAPYRGGAVRK